MNLYINKGQSFNNLTKTTMDKSGNFNRHKADFPYTNPSVMKQMKLLNI